MEIFLITDFNFVFSAIKISKDIVNVNGITIIPKVFFIRSLSYLDKEDAMHDSLCDKITKIIIPIADNVDDSKLYKLYFYLHDYNCIKIYNTIKNSFAGKPRPAIFRIILNLTKFDNYARELWRYYRYTPEYLNEMTPDKIILILHKFLTNYNTIITNFTELMETDIKTNVDIIKYSVHSPRHLSPPAIKPPVAKRAVYIPPPKILFLSSQKDLEIDPEKFSDEIIGKTLSVSILYERRGFVPENPSINKQDFNNNNVLYCSNLSQESNLELYLKFLIISRLNIVAKPLADISRDIHAENSSWFLAYNNVRPDSQKWGTTDPQKWGTRDDASSGLGVIASAGFGAGAGAGSSPISSPISGTSISAHCVNDYLIIDISKPEP